MIKNRGDIGKNDMARYAFSGKTMKGLKPRSEMEGIKCDICGVGYGFMYKEIYVCKKCQDNMILRGKK